MSSSPWRYALAGALAALGVGVLAAAAFDVYRDAIVQGDPAWTTLAENATTVALAVAVLAAARWTTTASALQVDRVAWWLPRTVAVAVAAVAWVLAFQSLQSRLKPAFLAADLLALLVLATVAIGVYDARQRESKRAVERQRDQFTALFENIPTPVVAVSERDDDAQIELVNPAFSDQFGLRDADAVGRTVEDVLGPTTASAEVGDVPDAVPMANADGGVGWRQAEVTLETEHGRRDFLRIAVPVGVEDATEDEFVYFIDVTEHKQHEAQLRVMSRTLRHDLRNKMTVVEGNASVLRDELDGEPAELGRRIQRASEELLDISEQTRAVERIIAGDRHPEPVALATVVDAVLADARETYPDATIELDGGVDASVQATDALSTALGNVVENAVEHNDTDAPTVTVSVARTADGEYVDVRVADDGPGIPEHEYELFADGEETNQLRHSSGLGLWVVDWIVTNLGGELRVERNEPRGSVVTLRLVAADRE